MVGSGKTLAYLVPVLQRVLDQVRNKTISPLTSRAPFVMVVTPTAELASQVGQVARALSNTIKFRSACFHTDCDTDSEDRKLRLGAEVVIGTPGCLLSLLDNKDMSLSRLQAIILDEADVLFTDQSFSVTGIDKYIPITTQRLFATATLPDDVLLAIRRQYPNITLLKGPGLHRVSPSVLMHVVDCRIPNNLEHTNQTIFDTKKQALFNILNSTVVQENNSVIDTSCYRTIVFCNSIEQCRRVENVLSRWNKNDEWLIQAFHSALKPHVRDHNMKEFCSRYVVVHSSDVCVYCHLY